jgi:hypothetical protein
MVAHKNHVTCHSKQCFLFWEGGGLSLATGEKAKEGAKGKNQLTEKIDHVRLRKTFVCERFRGHRNCEVGTWQEV